MEVVEKGSICEAAALNLEQNCLLQALETLYDHNLSHYEKVANSDSVIVSKCLYVPAVVVLQTSTEVEKLFLVSPSLYRWFGNIYASCTSSLRLMGGIYSLTVYTSVW